MELRPLRYFVAIAEAGGMSRAALKLNVVQSALSHTVARLEEELGVQLFHRLGRRLELSDAGKIFLEDAGRILGDVDRAILTAQRAARGHVGALRVGFQAVSCCRREVSEALRAFRVKFPEVELEIEPGLAIALIQRLQAKEIDAAFCYIVGDQPGLAALKLREEDWLLALPQGHRLLAHPALTAAQLRDERFVWIPRAVAPTIHDRLLVAASRIGLNPNIVQEAFDEAMILSLIGAGLGVAFVPASARDAATDDIAFRPVAGFTLPQQFCLLWRDADPSPQIANLREILQGAAEAAAP